MQAVEFTTELGSAAVIAIPPDVVAQLPKAGKARVIILIGDDAEDVEWREASCAQFLRDDSSEDSVYDSWQ
jgi:hypothetical protein